MEWVWVIIYNRIDFDMVWVGGGLICCTGSGCLEERVALSMDSYFGGV